MPISSFSECGNAEDFADVPADRVKCYVVDNSTSERECSVEEHEIANANRCDCATLIQV